MANNKITIRETNLTTPIRGTSSSDVVYVPGLTGIDNSPKNVATYVTSEKEFKELFGDSAYVLTGDDTASTFLEQSSYAFLKEDDLDRGYLYALQLLREGLSVYYEYIVQDADEPVEVDLDPELIVPVPATEVTSKLTYFYNSLEDAYERLIDKNEYTIKYLTSGGYPLAGITACEDIYKTMVDVAATRGDCIALIDHKYDPAMDLNAADTNTGLAEIVQDVGDKLTTNGTYAAMFSPWAQYVVTGSNKQEIMPASFAYLRCLASTIKTAPNFLAIAGVSRGRVQGIKLIELEDVLTSVIAEDFQPKQSTDKELQYSVNCITNIRPYGYTIWGNRTLAKIDTHGTTADNFLNTRNMLSDIKKVAYSTAKDLMFEQDSNVLWLRFKSGVSGVLEALKTGFGIKDYSIIRTTVDNTGNPYKRGTLGAIIRVYPLYAIEYFDIEIQVTDDDVTVNE